MGKNIEFALNVAALETCLAQMTAEDRKKYHAPLIALSQRVVIQAAQAAHIKAADVVEAIIAKYGVQS